MNSMEIFIGPHSKCNNEIITKSYDSRVQNFISLVAMYQITAKCWYTVDFNFFS